MTTHDKRKTSIRLVPNYRLLVLSGAIFLLGTIASVAWYTYQTRNLGEALLVRATEFEQNEQYGEAAEYLHNYLRENPGQGEIVIRLAETYEKSIRQPDQIARAIELYQRALGFADEKTEPRLRVRLGDLLFRSQRFTEAEKQARTILDKNSEDPGGLRLLAISTLTRWQESDRKQLKIAGYPSLGYVLKEAIRLNPTDTQLPLVLARIYRASPEESSKLLSPSELEQGPDQLARRADNLLDTLVTHCPEDAQAWLARYIYRRQYKIDDAQSDLDQALTKNQNDPEVLHYAIDREMETLSGLLRTNDPKQSDKRSDPEPKANQEKLAATIQTAEKYLRKALKLNPSDEKSLATLGRLLLIDNRQQEAIAVWESGLELQKNKPSLHLAHLMAATLITQGSSEDARKAIQKFEQIYTEQRHQLKESEAQRLGSLLRLMQADFHARCGEMDAAIHDYKQLLALSGSGELNDEQRQHILTALGNAQMSLGQADLAAASYDAVESVLHVQSPSALLQSAKAWSAAQRPELAVQRAKASLELETTPETLFVLASALLQQETRRSAEPRQWSEVEKVIDQLDKTDRSSWSEPHRLALLKVDLIRNRDLNGPVKTDPTEEEARKKAEETVQASAIKILQEAEKTYKDSPTAIRNFVVAYTEIGATEDARRLAEQATEQTDAPSFAPVLNAQLAIRQGDHKTAREILEKSLAETTPEQKPAIERMLYSLDLLEGDPAKVEKAWTDEQAKRPQAIEPIFQLANLAIAKGKLEEAESWEKKLYELEGEGGFFWRYARAQRRLSEASTTTDQSAKAIRVAEVAELLVKLQGLRPNWGKLELLAARLALLQNNPNEAISKYENAIRLGEDQLDVQEELISLLFETRQLDKAQQQLDSLRDHAKLSERLMLMDALLHEQQGHLDEAEAVLQKMVEANPQSAELQRALCSLLIRSDSQTKDAPAKVDPAKIEQAIHRIEKLIQEEKTPVADNYLLLASAYEKQENSQAAGTAYAKAVELLETTKPNPRHAVNILRAAGLYQIRQGDPKQGVDLLQRAAKIEPRVEQDLAISLLLQGRADEAIQSYERLLKHYPKDVIALNNLAALLGEKPERQAEALKYIEEAITLAGASKSLLDTKGVLLLQSGRTAEAVETLEKIKPDETTSAKDLLHLAAAYLKNNQAEKARQTYQTAVERGLNDQKLRPRDEQFQAELKASLSEPSETTEEKSKDS